MKKKHIKYSIFVFILIVCCLFFVKFQAVYYSKNINISNLKCGVSTSSYYVSLNIKNKQNRALIVCPNNILFDRLKKEKYFSVSLQCIYVYYVGSKILNNSYVEFGDSIYNDFRYDIVDTTIVRQLDKKNLFNDTTYVKDGFVNFNLNPKIQKAVIYSLLKQNIQCLHNCEGGTVSVLKDW